MRQMLAVSRKYVMSAFTYQVLIRHCGESRSHQLDEQLCLSKRDHRWSGRSRFHDVLHGLLLILQEHDQLYCKTFLSPWDCCGHLPASASGQLT